MFRSDTHVSSRKRTLMWAWHSIRVCKSRGVIKALEHIHDKRSWSNLDTVIVVDGGSMAIFGYSCALRRIVIVSIGFLLRQVDMV